MKNKKQIIFPFKSKAKILQLTSHWSLWPEPALISVLGTGQTDQHSEDIFIFSMKSKSYLKIEAFPISLLSPGK